jgi:hypothetical protein
MPGDDGAPSETVDAGSSPEGGAAGSPEGGAAGSPEGGAVDILDDGPDHCRGMALPDGGRCSTRAPGTFVVLGPTFSAAGGSTIYGAAPDQWDVYAFAGPGQTAPVITPSAGSISISATLSKTTTGQGSAGVGFSTDGAMCLDETSGMGRGVNFTLSGDIGTCSLFLDAIAGPDESSASDPCRGSCSGGAACVPSSVQLTQLGNMEIPNMAFQGGAPIGGAYVSALIGFRWRLQTPAGAGCTANFSIAGFQIQGP